MYVNSNNYIRKVDELGRIVIPKEVRNRLKIQDNESVSISINGEKINITKYSFLNNYIRFITDLCNQIIEIYRVQISIEDLERIIFSNIDNEDATIQCEDIIKDSNCIGKIRLSSSQNEENIKLTKLISRIITLFLTYH